MSAGNRTSGVGAPADAGRVQLPSLPEESASPEIRGWTTPSSSHFVIDSPGHRYDRGVSLIGFPNPVNEKAARTVAAVVAITSIVILATGWLWLLIPLAYGFWARVLTGPKLSPLGALSMKVIAPRLGEPVYTPGPPKRFAQGIGAALTTVAAITGLAFGWTGFALVLVAILAVFATLESVFGFCAGCFVFGQLMKIGVIPADVCEECNNIWARRDRLAAEAAEATSH